MLAVINSSAKPAPAQSPAPASWKIALLTFAGLYPLIMLMPVLFGPALTRMPLWLNTLLTLGVIVPAMNWLVMPFLTKALRRWLYPA